MKFLKLSIVIVAFSFLSTTLFAAGPHDGVTCLGCHSTHFAVDDKLLAVKNTKMKNPLTKKSFDKLVAKNCLGCHELVEFGGAGIRPVHMHTSHPIGMVPNPKIASVPKNLLRDGKLDCISCHEAHPSNKNFMYLRADVGAEGDNIQRLCVVCHDAKVDLASVGIKKVEDVKIFSAMDQKKGSGYFHRDKVTTENKTTKYIKPLGKLQENDIMPNYQNQPDWVYSPTVNPLDDFKSKKKVTKKKTTKKK